MPLTPEQIARFTAKARAAGFTDAQIAVEVNRKSQEVASAPQTPSPTAPAPAANPTPVPVAQTPPNETFVSRFIKTLLKPAETSVRTVAAAVPIAGLAAVGGAAKAYEGITGKKTNIDETAVDNANLIANKVMAPRSLQNFSQNNPENQGIVPMGVVKEGVQQGAGVSSYMIPGGAGLKSAIGLGAVSGGLFGLSEGDEIDVDNIINGAVGGAAGGAAFSGAGKLLKGVKSLIGKGAGTLANKASQGINKATPTMWQNSLEQHGFDLNTLTQKYFTKGSNYDDMLGKVSERGNGGKLKQVIDDAEKQIATELKATDSNTKVLMDDFIKDLQKEKKILSDMPGNENSIAALDEFIAAFMQKYKNGITPEKLLQLKRAADSKFGQAVVDESTGSAIAQAQKMFANAARSKLKALFPKIKDALDTETEIYTLRPVLNRARAVSKTSGSSLRPGKFNSLTDLINPFAYLDRAMTNPKIASRFLGAKGGEVGASATPPLVNKAGEMVGATAGTTPMPTPTADSTDTTTAHTSTTEETTNPFGEMTKQEVLIKAMAAGADRKDLEDIATIYDLVGGGTGASDANSRKRANAIKTAEIIYNQMEDLALKAPTGVWGSVRAKTGTLPGVEGGSAEDLKRQTEGFAKAIASAFAGEVGVATDKDIERWLGLMPKVGDTLDERKRALARLKEQIDANKAAYGVK